MAAAVSGRSSVEQDDEVLRRMRATPRTPMKMTPYRNGSDCNSTQRRRGLFQPSSPASDSSGGLGAMSPLTSSLESLHTICSPTFSPNGRILDVTPMKTRSAAEHEISVRSSLFPALKKDSMVRRSARLSPSARNSPSVRQSVAALQDMLSDHDSSPTSQTTPRTSRQNLTRRFVAESVASPSLSSVGTPPSQRKPQLCSAKPTVIPPTPSTVVPSVVHAVSPEDFYGPNPAKPSSIFPPSKLMANFNAPSKKLLIDTIGVRGRKLRRDSEVSVFTTITVASKRRRSTSRSTSRSSKRRKPAIPGVWHAIKKPKRMNKNAPKPRPAISPDKRADAESHPPPVMKSDRLFVEKPRNRIGGKTYGSGPLDGSILDPFPPPRIKRKKLPTTPLKEPEPDPSKKFMKHGFYRKAVFKIDNMSLEFTNGKVHVKSPEHRRRPRPRNVEKIVLDPVDFNMPEPETATIQNHVDDILQQLGEGYPDGPQSPKQISKITDEQLLHILESPTTKVKLVDASPSKVMTEVYSSPQKSLLRNMSGLQLNDGNSHLPLTGVLMNVSNILNQDAFTETAEDQENVGPKKFYPLFDPSSWKAATVLTDLSNIGKPPQRRKKAHVADDQYMLDAGQTSVAVVKCKDCGVMYQAGDYLDELAHNNFHNHLSDLAFMGWKEERVLTRYNDGRIVMVVASDAKSWQEKARKAVGVVDLELGFSENSLTWAPDKKVLLFICEKMKQIVGCLVAETCGQGYRMYPSIEGVEVDTCARDPVPCKLGVSRIWTAGHRRRQRIASRMFESLRRVCGDLAADDVAFSIPSPDGKMLASSLVQRQDFKVYGFLNS